MLSDLDHHQRALAEFMSSLSETAWYAGWMEGLEFELWRAIIDGPFRYGRLELTTTHIARLRGLSESCGGWILFDDELEEAFVPTDRWKSIYLAHTLR
jgi:hypothetical protein